MGIPDKEPRTLGDILKRLAPKIKQARRALQGRALAQQALRQALGAQYPEAAVVSVKAGVVVIETDAAASFQELEGFERERLLAVFRAAGLQAAEVRVRLREGH